MLQLGTARTASSTKVLLLGAGELGKELALAFHGYGLEVIAVDRYSGAPAMQVAERSHVLSMMNGRHLREIIEREKPSYIVPEIEAIDTDLLLQLESEGYTVAPCAKAVSLTMNRRSIRELAAEQLGLPTSPYHFAFSFEDCSRALENVGLPAVIKPIMSSSGKGQSVIRQSFDLKGAWEKARTAGRGECPGVIIESFVDFDEEVTLLTARHKEADSYRISFCPPIGHRQECGDYRESWQPHDVDSTALFRMQEMAGSLVEALGGCGIFGVEFFLKGQDVYFNEVSPRPHDTGLVTLLSQNLSEFQIHARAVLGLPIPEIKQFRPAASHALVAAGKSSAISFRGLERALEVEDSEFRIFGKPSIEGRRRLGVGLALGSSVDDALEKCRKLTKAVEVVLS